MYVTLVIKTLSSFDRKSAQLPTLDVEGKAHPFLDVSKMYPLGHGYIVISFFNYNSLSVYKRNL